MPDNITILPLPPKSPELNPVENVGSSSETTGSPTGSSPPTTTSSTIVAMSGTSSTNGPGQSCPSDRASGLINDHQRSLV